MFIRVKTKPGSLRKAVQLVESVREGKKVRQRIVRHIGVAETEAELEKLKDLGETIKVGIRCERQPPLLPREKLVRLAIEARREKARKGPPVAIEKIREERRITTGFHEAYGAVYRQLGFDGVLPAGKNRSARETLEHMAAARIANPDSKRGAARRMESELGVSIPVQKICRMMDRLDKDAIESMKDLAADAARKLLPEPASVVFFDCTTLHFESVEEDGLREFGFSKNGRHGRVQVLLALMVGPDGLPFGCEVFPGSDYEGKSLIPSLERMREREGIRQAVHVADRGMFGEANLKDMENRGLQYIVGARLKSLPKALKERILDLDSYRSVGGSKESRSAEFEHRGRRIVVGWSRARAEKDAADRRKAVEKPAQKLNRSANPAQALSSRGFGRFVKVEGDARLEVDEDKIEEAARWDGLKRDRHERVRHGACRAVRPIPRTLEGRGELPDRQARPQGAAGVPLEAGPGQGAHRHRVHGVRMREASGLPDRAAAEGADVAAKDPDRPRRPPMLDHARHGLEPALRRPFDDDAGHGPHLPDTGTPDVPNALLDRMRHAESITKHSEM